MKTAMIQMYKILLIIFFSLVILGCSDSSDSNINDASSQTENIFKISKIPMADGTSISISKKITISFTTKVDDSTVNKTNLYIEDSAGDQIGLVLELDETTKDKIIFTPYEYFKPSSTYTIVVTTALKDISSRALNEEYRYSFDTSDDEIISTELFPQNLLPASNSLAQADTSISITFERELSPEPMYTSSELIHLVSGSETNVSGSFEIINSSIVFTPTNLLDTNETYTASLLSGVKDLYGNSYEGESSWQFTINTSPTAVDDNITTSEDTVLLISPLNNDADINEDNLSILSFSSPSNGYLIDNNNTTLSYVPNLNFNGVDSFTYIVSDGNLIDVANVNITVLSVNDAPVTNDINASGVSNRDLNITLIGSDIDGDTLIYSNTSSPLNGTVSITSNTAIYTPYTDFIGSDTFTYSVTDGNLTSEANVSITIASSDTIAPTFIVVNPLPNAADVNIDINLSITFSEDISNTDVNGSLYDDFGNLVEYVTTVSGNILYINPVNSLKYDTKYTAILNDTIYDLVGNSSLINESSSFTTQLAPNNPPIAINDTGVINEDSPLYVVVLTNDYDDDNDTLSIVSFTQAKDGNVTDNGDSTFTYTPNPDFFGADGFTYTISDGNLTDTAEVNITINAINDIPTVSDINISITENNETNITLLGVDVDVDSLTYSVITSPLYGSVLVTGNVATYTPNANTTGVDSFTYKANDGNVDSTVATVSVTVTTQPDTTAPYIVSTYPVNNDINITLDTNITIVLSEDINTTDINGTMVDYLGNEVNGTASVVGNILTFYPEYSLNSDANYTVIIDDNISDLFGNTALIYNTFSFITTSTGVSTLPSVISTTPAYGSSDIDINSSISITFSTDMNESTLSSAISVSAYGGAVLGNVIYDSNTTTAIFTPTYPLVNSELYEVNIDSTALDLAGNYIESYTFSFTTFSKLVWTLETNSASFITRWHHQVVDFNNTMYLIGGSDENSTNLSDVYSSYDGIYWNIETNSTLFGSISEHQVVSYNERMYLIGGDDGTNKIDDVYSSSDGINWILETNSSSFGTRSDHQVVVYNHKMYLIAGYDDSLTKKNDVYSSIDGVNWILETSASAFTPRIAHQVVSFNGAMYLIGGNDGSFKNDVWLSSDGTVWEEITPNASFAPRAGHQVVVYNERMYIIGGDDGVVTYNDVWSSFDGLTWIQEDANSTFSQRAEHQVLVYNDRMHLVGGSDKTNYYNDIWSSNDIAAPYIIYVKPEDNATISADSNITFVFSEDINSTDYNITLIDVNSTVIAGTISLNANTIEFNPDTNLTQGETYFVSFDANVSDIDGNNAFVNYLSQFKVYTAFQTDTFAHITYDNSDFEYGNDTVVDADGNIFVTGLIAVIGVSTNMAIWKYTNDGKQDSTFGTAGIVTFESGNGTDIGISIALDLNGSIYVSGLSNNGTNDDMAIWKYDSNGTIDTSFNGGFVIDSNTSGGDGDDTGISIAVDKNGSVYVSGSSMNENNDSDMVIWKYDSNGTLDSSFNSGIVIYDNGYNDSGDSIVLDLNGSVYVAGSISSTLNTDMAIWKYDSSGVLDSTFNSIGFVVDSNLSGGDGDDNGISIETDENGNVYVTGYSFNGSYNDMALWKYNSIGLKDYNTSRTNTAGGGMDDRGHSIALDSRGSIYITGISINANGDSDMVIWKYENNGTIDSTFNGGFLVYDNNNTQSSSDYGNSIFIDINNDLYITGSSSNDNDDDMVLWRYKNP